MQGDVQQLIPANFQMRQFPLKPLGVFPLRAFIRSICLSDCLLVSVGNQTEEFQGRLDSTERNTVMRCGE